MQLNTKSNKSDVVILEKWIMFSRKTKWKKSEFEIRRIPVLAKEQNGVYEIKVFIFFLILFQRKIYCFYNTLVVHKQVYE